MKKLRKTIGFLLSFMLAITFVFSSGTLVFADDFSNNDTESVVVEQEVQNENETELVAEEPTPEEVKAEEAGAKEEVAQPAKNEVTEPANDDVAEPVKEEAAEVAANEVAAPAEEIIEEVAFSESVIVDGVKVKVTADKGVFPEGAVLKVEKADKKETAAADKAIEKIAEGLDVAVKYTFDITILDAEGNEIQPNTEKGQVKVSFTTEEVGDDSLKADVYHIGDDGQAKALKVKEKNDTATVKTDGFSLYSLIFTHVDTGTQVVYTTTMAVGQRMELWTLLKAVGITEESHGSINNATSDNNNYVRVYRQYNTGPWRVEAVNMDNNQHRVEVTFTNNVKEVIVVSAHRHNWLVSNEEGVTDKVSVKCVEQNCAYEGATFTAEISASEVTYDGNLHTATKTLSPGFPESDVATSGIRYRGAEGTTYADSSQGPRDAGTYIAYYTVTPQGGNSYTVSTTFTIKKADIVVTAPTGYSVTYDGGSQVLHSSGSARSSKTSATFSLRYADGNVTDKAAFTTNRISKRNANTYTISYYAPGDANHNDSEIKTITAEIQKKEVVVTGITAKNKVYDGTATAELVTGGAVISGKVDGDTLTVTTKSGTFEDKNIGTGKTVTFKVEIGGESAANYYIASSTPTTTQANITQKALTINWYDTGNVAYTGEAVLPRAELERSETLTPEDGLAYTTDDVSVIVQQVDNGKEMPSINVGEGYAAKAAGLTGTDAANYNIDSGNVTVRYNIINQPVTILWKGKAGGAITVQYNGENQIPEIESIEGIKEADLLYIHARLVEEDAEGRKDVGSYELQAELYADEGHEATLADYALDSSRNVHFVITKAPLTITASGWITYGQPYNDEDAHVSISCEGFLGQDNEENSLDLSKMGYRSSVHDQFASVGVYQIGAEKIASRNYEITYEDGNLIIYPKTVELEWYDEDGNQVTDQENSYTYNGVTHKLTAKVVGTDADNKIHYQTESGEHVDTVAVQSYSGARERKDANLKAEGDEHWNNPYIVHAVNLDNKNYTLLQDPKESSEEEIATAFCKWYIDPLPVFLVWSPDSLVYNANDQWESVTAVIFNRIAGDDVSLVYNEGTARNVDTYTKEVTALDGADKDNYTLYKDNVSLEGEFVDGYQHEWTITKAPLAVKCSGWITYGEKAAGTPAQTDIKNAAQEAGADFLFITSEHPKGDPSKLLGEDTVEAQINSENCAYESTYNQYDPVTASGTAYTVTPAGLTSANYEITYEADILTVYPKPVTLYWESEDGSKVSPEEPFIYIYNGKYRGLVAKVDPDKLVNGDTAGIKTYTGNEERDACVKKEVEKYTSVATEIDNANYTLLIDPKKYTDGKVDPEGTAGTETTATDRAAWKILPLKVQVESWKFDTEEKATVYNGVDQDNVVTWNLVKGDEDTLIFNDGKIKKDAGTYTAKITGVEDKNYTIEGVAPADLMQEWIIYQKPVTLEWFDEAGNQVTDESNRYTYNGAAHTLSAKVVGTDENNEFHYPTATGENVDVVTVATYTGARERKDTNIKAKETPFTVHAATLSNSNYTLLVDPQKSEEELTETEHQDWFIDPLPVVLTWSPDTLVYNAYDQWDSVTAVIFNRIAEDDVTPVYNELIAKDVDTYTKEVTALDGKQKDNYTLYKDNVSLSGDLVDHYQHEWTITKAPLTIKGTGWITYGEQAKGTIEESDVKGATQEAGGDFLFYTTEHPKGDPVMLLGEDTGADQLDETNGYYESTYNQYDPVTSAGTAYTITAAGVTSRNYEITFLPDTLTVYPKPITLYWESEDGSVVSPDEPFVYTYDGTFHSLVAKADPDKLVNNDKVGIKTYTGNEEKDTCVKKEVEKYTSVATEIDNGNYTLLIDPKKYIDGKVDPEGTAGTETTVTDRADWKIDPRKVEVESWTFDTEEKATVYNGKEQENLATWNLIKGDEDTLIYNEGKTQKDAGTYTVKITGVEDKNYTIEGVDPIKLAQDWTIKPVPVLLKWKWGTVVYNGEEQTNTAEVTNVISGDKVVLTYEGNVAKDAGTYKAAVTGIDNGNYTVENGGNVTSEWTITKAKLTAIANNKTILYKQAPANAGVTYSGLKGKDTASVVAGTPKYSYNYQKNGKAGKYTIKIDTSNLTAKNYDISGKNGTLQVNDNVTILAAKAVAKGKRNAVFSWNKVTGAKSYTVYLAPCNTNGKVYKMKSVGTVTGNTFTVKKLKKATFYKFKVVAKTSSGKIKSITGHFTTGNAKGIFTNAKSLKLNKTNVTLNKGGSFKIKGTITKANPNLRLNTHAAQLRFLSDNTQVAKVDAKGNVTAVGSGWCRICVQTVNGIYKVVNVTVK